ncbi:MAG: outer membrane lipoprotein LolB [Alteromonadaceae bacterium]|nr:outer membrane lipoprotein LolB [Alteromonadaceae bacterium]
MIRHIAVLFICIWVTGCAVAPTTTTSWDTNQPLVKWTAKGRIAFDDGNEKFSATVTWKQDQQQYDARLSKLIGGTLLHLVQEPLIVRMEVDDKHYRDIDAELLIQRVFGWDIPVASFPNWLLAKPNEKQLQPGSVESQDGQIKRFTTEQGWLVSYQNYQQVRGIELPKSLQIKKDNIKIKLRISEWQLHDI